MDREEFLLAREAIQYRLASKRRTLPAIIKPQTHPWLEASMPVLKTMFSGLLRDGKLRLVKTVLTAAGIGFAERFIRRRFLSRKVA